MILNKKIVNTFIPFIGTLLVACGYVKFSIYYNHFDIRINDYLEFSEVLTLFFPDIIFYGLIIFGALFFNFILESKSETQRFHNIKQTLTDSSKFLDRIKLHYLLNKGLVWISLILVLSYIIQFIWFREKLLDTFYSTFFIPILLIFNILLLEFRHKYKELYKEYFNPTYNNLILIFFLFSLYSIGSVYGEIKRIEGGSETMVSFIYLDEGIETDDNLIYIGQTRNYLFLRDNDRNESRVFERKELNKFRIGHVNK